MPLQLRQGLALVAVAATGRFLSRRGAINWLAATALLSLALLVHVTTAMMTIPASVLAYIAAIVCSQRAGSARQQTLERAGDARPVEIIVEACLHRKLPLERIDAPASVAAKWTPTEAELKEYEGNYPLVPTFGLRVFSTGAKLFVQGTNQGPLEVASVDKDVFVAESVGAEIDFERDANGRVIALTLKQHGQVLHGERQ